MACKYLYQGVWHTEEQLKSIYENSTGPQVAMIQNAIRSSLPTEISNTINVVNNVPIDVLGRNDLFLSLKDILNDKGINDEMLINWAGINKDRVSARSIKSEDQLVNSIQAILKDKQRESAYVEFKINPLALESFRKWNKALEKYPVAFQDIMLSHAIKWLTNPIRRQKYVLQLSETSLANAYGIVVNKPHELNRIGKLYDQEVLKTVSDAVGHEPSASGNGYWVHIPRTSSGKHLGYNSYEDFVNTIKKVEDDIKSAQEIKNKKPIFNTQEPGLTREDANKYGFEDYTFVRVESSHGRNYANPFPEFLGEGYQGYYIHGYNTERGKPSTKVIPITKKEAENLWKKENERHISIGGNSITGPTGETWSENAYEVGDRQNLYRLKDNILRLERLKKDFEGVTPENWDKNDAQFKVNMELLRKLSPSTWCTASGQAAHYVENYDNYLLIVNGITVQGVEAGNIGANGKIQVKEATSRANNGTASIDHLDDTLAFFEKHNLDTNNQSLKNAIRAKANGKTDVNHYKDEDYDPWAGYDADAEARERWAIDEHNGEHEYDPPDLYDRDPEEELHDEQLIAAINTPEQALREIENNNVGEGLPVLRLFRGLPQYLKDNEEIANKAIDYDSHNITSISTTVPFYNELVRKAVTKNPFVFDYLQNDVKELPGLREIYDNYNRRARNGELDDLPFSKTTNNQIQGYYDAKNDKVVVVASNTSVNEAPKVAIHEVAHRGMIRMAKELGGLKELTKVLLNSEKELMKKLPELLKRTGHKNIESLLKDYGFNTNSEEGKSKLLMELAARWAETFVNKPKDSWWKEFLTNIKNWISKFTGKILNEDEVNELVGGFVKYGTIGANNSNIDNVDQNKGQQEKPLFEKQLMSYLQDKGIISSKEFPSGSGNFYVKKTYLGQDRNSYAPEEVERNNLAKIDDINHRLGFQAIETVQVGNGLVVKINSQLSLFDGFQESDLVKPIVSEADRQYQHDNLLTDDTHDLIDNVYRVGLMLNKPDLVNVGTILKKNSKLLQNVKTEVVEEKDTDRDLLAHLKKEKISAQYNAATNTITLFKAMMDGNTIEKNSRILMEELLHALTVQPSHKVELGQKLTANEKEFYDKIDSLYKYYKDNANKALQTHYRFKNQREFIIGMLLDPNFKDHLEEIDNKKAGFIKTIFDDFIKAILRLLGIKTKAPIFPFEKLTTEYVNQYISNKSIVEPLIVDRSHDLISEARDIASEKEALKTSLNDSQKQFIKDKIESNLLQIKSIGATGRQITSKNQRIQIFQLYKKFSRGDLDTIDYFFSFTREINSIMDSLLQKGKDINTNRAYLEDPNARLGRWSSIMDATRDYDSIIAELGEIRAELFDEELLAQDMDNIVSKRARLEADYTKTVFPILSEFLTKEVSSAVQKAVEYLDDEIKSIESHITRASKAGNTKRVNNLKKDLEKKQTERDQKYNITNDKMQDWLRGKMGDSNTLSMYFEAAIVQGNPIVAVLAKFVKDAIHEQDPEILNFANSLQTEIDRYERETGISKNNIEEFNKPLLTEYDVIESMDDDYKPTYKKKLALLGPWNMQYISDLQMFSQKGYRINDKITKANKDIADVNQKIADEIITPEDGLKQIEDLEKSIEGWNKELKSNVTDRLQFIKDYMERPYLNEVHSALDLIHKDLGGFTAHEYVGDAYDHIRDIEELIEETDDDIAKDMLYSELEIAKFDLKQLRTTYEKDPDSREYKVAELLTERDEELKKYRNFELRPDGLMKFERDKERIDRNFKDGGINEKEKNYWYQSNTTTEIAPAYWDTKKAITNEMAEILENLGIKKEDNENLSSLYKQLQNIVKPYRDDEGVIQGGKFNEKQVADVKKLEETIEKLKEELPNMFGLTKLERIELSNLYEQLNHLFDLQQGERDATVMRYYNEEQIRLETKINELESKKKKFDKKSLEKYFSLLKKLLDMDNVTESHYYTERYDEEYEKYMSAIPVDNIPAKFSYEKIGYERTGSQWYAKTAKGLEKIETSEAEKMFRNSIAEKTFKDKNEWYKNNHITRTSWVASTEEFDPTNPFQQTGAWEEVTEPLYIWKYTRPKDEKMMMKEQPSIKYKRSRIKDEFKNPHYRESINGQNVPKINGAKDDRYINQQYINLANATDNKNAAIFRYLKYLTDEYFESQKLSRVPINQRPGYEMPSIPKSDLERITLNTKDGLTHYVGQILRGFKRDVIKNEQDKDMLFGYTDNKGSVPMKFHGEIDIKDISRDVSKSMGAYRVVAAQRQSLVNAFPILKVTRDILEQEKNRPTKVKNGVVITMAKKFLPRNTVVAKHIEGSSNTLNLVNEMINSFIFGEKIKDEAGAKILNNIFGVGANLMLGLNFGSMVQNWTNAKIQSIFELESKLTDNFSGKSWAKAQTKYWANIKDLIADMNKYGNRSYINQFIDYFGGINFNITNKFNKNLAYRTISNTTAKILMPTEMAEHELSTVLFLAIGDHFKVDQKIGDNTIRIPLVDAFHIENGKFKLKDGVQFNKDIRKEFINKVNSSARRINGEYGGMDAALTHKYELGRSFEFMNKYFVPFFMRRFGKRRFNVQDGIRDDGFYRTFFKTIGKDLYRLQFNMMRNWKYYNESEKAAFKQAFTEMGVSVVLILLTSALGGTDPKDLKNNGVLANNIIYVIKGIRRQNEQFMPVPGLGLDDVWNRIKNPFPIMTKVGQTMQILNDMVYLAGYEMNLTELKDIQYMKKTGWHDKGDLKIFSDLGKLFSLPQKVHQLMHPDQALQNLNAYRLK